MTMKGEGLRKSPSLRGGFEDSVFNRRRSNPETTMNCTSKIEDVYSSTSQAKLCLLKPLAFHSHGIASEASQ